MPKKDGLGFSVDERTNVPTYEEVASVFRRHKNKIKKPSKRLLSILFLIVIIGGISATAYVYKDNIQNGMEKTSFSLTGFSISGFMTNNIDYDDKNKFGYEIKELEINLTNEEQVLKSNLTSDLSSTCQQQKTSLAADIRDQEEEECTTEKTALETEITTWKDRYTLCNEENDDE